ncbi:TPA_asm: G [Glycyrrhiza betacytorhabdovirus 1]|nr:TPA_asm: G [Glycyrrhiza betacytorhabdovirus 1]
MFHRITNIDLLLMLTISSLITCISSSSNATTDNWSVFRRWGHKHHSDDLYWVLRDFQFKLVMGFFLFVVVGTIIYDSVRFCKQFLIAIIRNIVIFILASISSMLLMVLLPSHYTVKYWVISILEEAIKFFLKTVEKDFIHRSMWRRHFIERRYRQTRRTLEHHDHTHLI